MGSTSSRTLGLAEGGREEQRRTQVIMGSLGLLTIVLILINSYANASPHAGSSVSKMRQHSADVSEVAAPWKLPLQRPLLIAHRGASFAMPELAPESYQFAIEKGADSIECDILLTKDLVPICRHNPELDLSTNVQELFSDRTTTKVIDGHEYTGVFASDLTLSEIKQLHLIQPLSSRDQQYNGKFKIATLEEFLQIALDAPRTVAVHVEVKHPRHHNSLPAVREAGTSMEQIVLGVMERRGFKGPINSPQWLQQPSYLLCFDGSWLKDVAKMGSCIPRLLLVKGGVSEISPDGRSVPELLSKPSLDDLKQYVDVIGPGKGLLAKWVAEPEPSLPSIPSASGGFYQSTGLVELLHAKGFQVHTYTFREEDQFRFPGLSVTKELELLLTKLGIDGVISDSISLVAAFLKQKTKEGVEWDMSVASAVRNTCPAP